MIPVRFQKEVNAHLMGNYLNISNFPVILSIFGEPGMGKTWQLRTHLRCLGIKVYSISSADLESNRAGEPAKLLKKQYEGASEDLGNGVPTAIVIDDIDTTLGEWKNNTGTVNHQNVIALLMHIADNPNYLEGFGNTKRVPIFITGNNYALLYAPLIRDGRANYFEWKPTEDEKCAIVASILNFQSENDAKEVITLFPDKPISFFSSFHAKQSASLLSSYVSNAGIDYIVKVPEFKEKVKSEYHCALRSIDWKAEFQIYADTHKNSPLEKEL